VVVIIIEILFELVESIGATQVSIKFRLFDII
jgi:hypothetical protein